MACGISAPWGRLQHRAGNQQTERKVVGGAVTRSCGRTQAGMVDLGTLGGRTSCANDVNDLGCIVGVSQTDRTDARGLRSLARFSGCRTGALVDLGTLGGNQQLGAAISEEAGGVLRIAGHSHDAAAGVRAVLWTVRLG